MAAIPPPYAPREHAQVQPALNPAQAGPSSTTALEFAETSSTTLEWRLNGLRAMYDTTKGESKSKCIKSAIFGDVDNHWEVLWYPNSGVAGGEFASLYLSCVPTAQEREASIGSKWVRQGLWWFRFEIKSLIPDDRTGKIITLATKDASDHTFAVKTANWGWQQFAKRDSLFLHPTVLNADGFVIQCTIQAQAQPPTGYWLGMGLPADVPFVSAHKIVGGKAVGSGGGLSAWAGGEGASGGVAGGSSAAGGTRKVVPRELVGAFSSLLDDPLYSDVEFIFPPRKSRGDGEKSGQTRRIYAAKKLLTRCEYFQDMFTGGFREVEGVIESEDEDDPVDTLSDSDMEEEAFPPATMPQMPYLTSTTSRASSIHQPRRLSTSGDTHMEEQEQREEHPGEDPANGEGHADESIEEVPEIQKKENTTAAPTSPSVPAHSSSSSGPAQPSRHSRDVGPKKTKVVVRDAAWSTWWAILYYLYTDMIYFAPLTSSFDPTSTRSRGHSRPGSMSSFPSSHEIKSRRDWILQWMDERNITDDPSDEDGRVGPRPVSAKAVYRLADKLDLPALRMRAFQHIMSELTAQNIPAEVFSRFSSTFEDVRKVQVAYFLKHWTEIKKSETMTQIWQQIRLGKHVGFEEVWPLIVGQLDFKPS